jgi:hypothetical protein
MASVSRQRNDQHANVAGRRATDATRSVDNVAVCHSDRRRGASARQTYCRTVASRVGRGTLRSIGCRTIQKVQCSLNIVLLYISNVPQPTSDDVAQRNNVDNRWSRFSTPSRATTIFCQVSSTASIEWPAFGQWYRSRRKAAKLFFPMVKCDFFRRVCGCVR